MAPVHFNLLKSPECRSLSELTLAELRSRIMTEPEGRKLSNLLAEIASRLDLNVSLEDFHVAQQLFHVSGLNTRLQINRRSKLKDAERLYWQKRRLFKSLLRLTKPNWRAFHRCDEFCVDNCYYVCAVNEKVCYKCEIQFPIYIAKYPQRSYFSNLFHLVKKAFNKTGSESD